MAMTPTQRAARALGRRGGRAKSEAKTAAVRANAKLGGRRPKDIASYEVRRGGEVLVGNLRTIGKARAALVPGARIVAVLVSGGLLELCACGHSQTAHNGPAGECGICQQQGRPCDGART